VRADEKLRASFSRSIDVGVSQTFNLALRRLQLSVTQDRPIVSFPLASLSQPYVVVPRPRLVPYSSRPVLTRANFVERLTAAFADPMSTSDSSGVRGVRGGVSRGCRAASVESVD
jgi:hypothetical protein